MTVPEIVAAASQEKATEADFQAFVAAAKANPEEVRLVLDTDRGERNASLSPNLQSSAVCNLFLDAKRLGSDVWQAVALAMIEMGSTVAMNEICGWFGLWHDEHSFAQEILPVIERAGALDKLRPSIQDVVDSAIKSMFRDAERDPHYGYPNPESSAKWLAEQFPPLSPALRHLVVQVLIEAPSPGSDASFYAEQDSRAAHAMCHRVIDLLK